MTISKDTFFMIFVSYYYNMYCTFISIFQKYTYKCLGCCKIRSLFLSFLEEGKERKRDLIINAWVGVKLDPSFFFLSFLPSFFLFFLSFSFFPFSPPPSVYLPPSLAQVVTLRSVVTLGLRSYVRLGLRS